PRFGIGRKGHELHEFVLHALIRDHDTWRELDRIGPVFFVEPCGARNGSTMTRVLDDKLVCRTLRLPFASFVVTCERGFSFHREPLHQHLRATPLQRCAAETELPPAPRGAGY